MCLQGLPKNKTKQKEKPTKKKKTTQTPKILTIINYLPLSLKIMIKNK